MAQPEMRPCALGNAGADWNVQAVQGGGNRGKVTSKCLWNACKALTLGIILMLLGASMAILGYHADQLSVNQEVRGNTTVKVKNESRGFHLNNFSYAGPIVMGVGGFIVVAACVMTFEARDSAAKVVPAKFRPKASPACGGGGSGRRGDDGSGRRSAGCQTRWDNLGVFRAAAQGATNLGLATPLASAVASPALSAPHHNELKQSFLNFSKHFQSSIESSGGTGRRQSLAKCPSAPNIAALVEGGVGSPLMTALQQQFGAKPVPPALLNAARLQMAPNGAQGRRQSSSVRRGCNLLTAPHPLQRQALSVDYTNMAGFSPPLAFLQSRMNPPQKDPLSPKSSVERAVSEASMAMDLHLPDDCQVTLKVRDQTRVMPPRLHQRSETARRHQLTRQKPVVDIESSANEIQTVGETRVRRHHSSKREGRRHHRHRVKRSNTCATPQDSASHHQMGDVSPLPCISLTPSPERSHASCSLQVQVDSNPPSSNQSFELSPVGQDAAAAAEGGGAAAAPDEAAVSTEAPAHTQIHIEEVQ